MIKYIITLSLLASVSIQSMTRIENVKANTDIDLFHYAGEFYVLAEGELNMIKHHDCDDLSKKIRTQEHLKAFQKAGYFELKKLDNSYILRSKVRGNGGGYITGEILYWGTKVLCYGSMAFVAKKAIEQSPVMRPIQHTPVGNGLNQAGYALARPLVTDNAAGFATAGVVGFLEKSDTATQNQAKEAVVGSIVVFGGGKVIAGVEVAANVARGVGYSIPWLP